MLEFRLNGDPLPVSVVAGVAYTVNVCLDGAVLTPIHWEVTGGGVLIASGVASSIVFTPLAFVPHTITAQVVGEFDLPVDLGATINVSARPDLSEAGVKWSQLTYGEGATVSAQINARDLTGKPPLRMAWTLARNGQTVLAGTGSAVTYDASPSGLYRLSGIVYTSYSQLAFDSTVLVGSGVTGQPNLPLPDAGGTQVYLGAVFTQNVTADSGAVPSLPYQLGSFTEDIYLLPGTTHWSFDLDPDGGPLDDELIVRTQKGNWCLNGFNGGLTGESVGYDYGYLPAMIPAPVGSAIRITVDLFKVHGVTHRGTSCRVRIRCYRRLAQAVYSYNRCAASAELPGGLGRRARRWAALFTSADIETDVFSGLNRFGSAPAVIAYTTENTSTVPLVRLRPDGYPHPVRGYTGLSFTDSNLYAIYEAEGQPDIAACAIAAIENVRPCCISFQMFDGSRPLICNRVSRLHGKLSVYLLDGAVLGGSVVHVTVSRSEGLSSSSFSLPIAVTQYANADDTLLQVGSITVDLADYQFDETGVVVSFSIDESGVTSSALPVPMPTPVTAAAQINTLTYASTVLFDGACYTQPTYVPVLDAASAVVVTPAQGCHDSACGLPALYCYTDTLSSGRLLVPQPFGLPSPYVAFASAPAHCYGSPVPVVNINGTQISVAPYVGTYNPELRAYADATLCGDSYAYTDCQAAYAPCAAYACAIVVVYPHSSSPHDSIEYAGRCYSFSGSTQAYGTMAAVAAAAVNPTSGCHDPACNLFNSSGSVVVYNDTQTGLEVPVTFPRLDLGVPRVGVLPSKQDSWLGGLTAGKTVAAFHTEPEAVVYTSPGTGTMEFRLGLAGVLKQVVVTRNGARLVTPANAVSALLALQPGDSVSLRIADSYNRLPPRYHGLRAPVSWQPVLSLPRLYDTVSIPYAGSSAINAVGFCAYAAQGAYSFYGTLPFNGAVSGAVNPDSLLTVTGGDGLERVLISNRAVGDIDVFTLSDMPWYAGQVLNGPFTFKFYAGRSAFGAHGEMDVWLASAGTFPGYFAAGPYASLVLNGSYYRKDPSPTDTHRGAYQVTGSTAQWPCVYVSADGQVVSVGTNLPAVAYGNTAFYAPTWPTPVFDSGLAFTIVPAASVVTTDWTADNLDPWQADSGESWQA